MAEDSSGLILPPENPAASKKHLIEEISTTDEPEVHKPAYEMTTKKDADEEPLEIELKIELPDVCGVSECNLSISKVRQLQIAYYFHPSSFASQPHLNLISPCIVFSG